MAQKNKNLHAAKAAKNDEFYTQYNDIAEELKHYTKHFEGKTVFCNCDDPEWSKFWQYFVAKFESLKLKKLISTHYNMDGSPSYALTFEGQYGEDGKEITNRIELKGNGDFRSEECIEFLKEADIVCTNPPFSSLRLYISQLIEYDKKFIIIGHQNAITYKEVFPLIKEGKIWLGNGFQGNVGFFKSPYKDTAVASTHKEGLIRVSGVLWFTNLDIQKRHKPLILLQDYNIEDYPKYQNYDAINVDRTKDIPDFYDGVMGVPITFLEKHCPEQFEILDCREPAISLERLRKNPKFKEYKSRQIIVDDVLCQKTYHRLFIRRKGDSHGIK